MIRGRAIEGALALIYGTGIDIIEVERLRGTIERRGKAFLERVFTPAELEYCGRDRRQFRRLAARFAAKEAILKALGIGLRQVKWVDAEIMNDSLGKPVAVLRGRMAEIAAERGVGRVIITLSHSRDYAVAQAIALMQPESSLKT
jgi:holo-[acyl-carrier protein] synthase